MIFAPTCFQYLHIQGVGEGKRHRIDTLFIKLKN